MIEKLNGIISIYAEKLNLSFKLEYVKREKDEIYF